MPSVSATLIDASRKKVSFLNHVIRLLRLKGIDALQVRLEDLIRDHRQHHAFDVITCRAFSSLRQFVLNALPLLKPGGFLLALKGKEAETELAQMMEIQKGVPVLKLTSTENITVFLEISHCECILPYLNVPRRLIQLRHLQL